VTEDEERRAIIAELAAILPRRIVREPYMFTAGDVAAQTGRQYAQVIDALHRLAERGQLKMERDGHDPTTGRRVTLFWRPEDEPVRQL